MSRLENAVDRVVGSGSCTGCGGCALVSERVSMQESKDGFLRPKVRGVTSGADAAEAARFKRICPGVRVVAPIAEEGTKVHPIFGRHVSVWRAWAGDEETRDRGSSGGVLTALSTWLLETGRVDVAHGVASAVATPKRTVPVKIMSRQEALASAGSRYAPVASLAGVRLDGSSAIVAKPCEVAAALALSDDGRPVEATPILLSFFCAGTPSQHATDSLVGKIGLDPDNLQRLKYRGDGWPGFFTATDKSGETAKLSYSESWGKHLGRDLQMRCKLCVDGTGESGDIAVGDFWDTDPDGYPLFAEQDGESVAIARTKRGHELMLEAAKHGAIVLEALDLDLVSPVQPLQVKRRLTLAGRLLGRRLAGFRAPRYPGYRLARRLLTGGLVIYKTAAGTFLRSLKARLKGGSADR